jgi:hypothetical protein
LCTVRHKLRCPYHAPIYALDGKLIDESGEAIDRYRYGLVQVAVPSRLTDYSEPKMWSFINAIDAEVSTARPGQPPPLRQFFDS